MIRVFIYPIALLCLLLSSCGGGPRYAEALDEAARLADSVPSEALVKLGEIKNTKRLSAAKQAEYNLIFIKSMIRLGNKLGSDSVIGAATQYYRNRNDSALLHQTLFYNGIYHYRNAAHDSAVIYFDRAAEAVPAGNDMVQKAEYKRMAGYSHLRLGNAQQAVNAQKEALQYTNAANDSASTTHSLLSLANAYRHNEETELSLATYMQALSRIREARDRDMEAGVLNTISGIYETNGRIKEALSYKNKAQQVKRNRHDVPAVNLCRAILFGKQNMPDSARHYAQLSVKGEDQFVADLAYTFLGILEEKEGHYAAAMNLSKNSEKIFDSFLSGIQWAEAQQKYEKVKLENENNRLKIKQREHQFYLLACAFLLFLMLIVFYVIRANGKRKNERAAHENRMFRLQQDNLLLKQRQEISLLREKEAILRESLFRRINFFSKLPSLHKEESDNGGGQGKIKITRNDWQELASGIRDAYPDFLHRLTQLAPALSDDDVRFCCLLKINVNMQDLSDIYCVSKAAITKRKYRLKTEKFNITDNNLNLDAVLQQMY